MVNYDISKVIGAIPEIIKGLPMTLLVLLLTTILGSLLGGLITWASLSKNKVLENLAKGYVFILRCTPPIVLLFLVFYGVPEFLNWWLGLDINDWSKLIFVLVTMVLLFSAMISEVFKAAYQAIPKGQLEAGLSIGLTSEQTFVRIITPQAFRIALPNITTAMLNLMRDSALAYTIGFIDVMVKGNLLISRHLGNYSLETYTAVALVYCGIALIISLISRMIEKKLSIKAR